MYALIVVLFRLTGKRGLASMNTFDFVIFLLSKVVQNALIVIDDSLIDGMIGAVTLVRSTLR